MTGGPEKIMEKDKEIKGYVHGSTVRHLQPAPSEEEIYRRRRRDREERREKERRNRKKQRELDKFYRMDFLSFFLLFAGTMIVLALCCSMISSQTKVTNIKKSIAAKEMELSNLQRQNDSELAEINAGIDLTKIYKKATKKLGMVHAEDNQVIAYDSTKSDCVRQYGDIRKEDSK